MNPQILIVTPTRCQNCGVVHTSSRLFTVEPQGDRQGRHMKPATVYYGTRTLEKLQVDPLTTPLCHTSVDAATQDAISDRESYDRWQLAVQRKKAQERAERQAAAPPRVRTAPTLEDLL